MPLDPVTDAQWEALVTRAAGVVLVDVWAAWCTPCRALTPVLEALAQRHAGTVRVLALDADANPATVAALGVRALPTVLRFSGGVEQRRLDAPPPARPAPSDAPAQHAAAEQEAARLLASEQPLLLFKHSRTCPISHAAHAQLEHFRRAHPTVAVRLVVVQDERPLSQAIAAATGVRHESPQALVLHRGGVAWHASHGAISASRLATAFGA
jgi:thioredoxin 1